MIESQVNIRSIGEMEEEIVSEFTVFDEWLDKYEYLIELGKELESINESDKTDDNLIRAVSRVSGSFAEAAEDVSGLVQTVTPLSQKASSRSC